MSTRLQITDSLGERSFEPEHFPLSLGGPGCAVVVDSAASGPLAWLGLDEDALFAQSAGTVPLLHNGVPVQVSAWLHAGDVMTLGPALLRLENRDGTRHLIVDDGVAAMSRPRRSLIARTCCRARRQRRSSRSSA